MTEHLQSVQDLAQRVEQEYAGIRTDCADFRTGAIVLEVHWQSRAWVFAYTPNRGFAVGEVRADETADEYAIVTPEFTAAADKLLELLAAAQ
ncbi:MAG: hypothetical protein RL701_7907 [Pseudomonadota bacterium]